MPGKMWLSGARARVAAASRAVVVMPYNTRVLRRSIRPMRFRVFSHVEEPASSSSTTMYRLA